MDPKLWIYEHFDLIFNSNINLKPLFFNIHSFKNYSECKMQLDSNYKTQSK
jgi:hypothetical protein